MYEKLTFHAIQHTNTKDFSLRYRIYPNKAHRDRVYNFIKAKTSHPCEKVTLTVIAEPYPEQEELDIEEEKEVNRTAKPNAKSKT